MNNPLTPTQITMLEDCHGLVCGEIDPRFAAAHYMDGRDLVLPISAQIQPNGQPVCEDCDTVAHCMRCGCVPKVPLTQSDAEPASVEEAGILGYWRGFDDAKKGLAGLSEENIRKAAAYDALMASGAPPVEAESAGGERE